MKSVFVLFVPEANGLSSYDFAGCFQSIEGHCHMSGDGPKVIARFFLRGSPRNITLHPPSPHAVITPKRETGPHRLPQRAARSGRAPCFTSPWRAKALPNGLEPQRWRTATASGPGLNQCLWPFTPPPAAPGFRSPPCSPAGPSAALLTEPPPSLSSLAGMTPRGSSALSAINRPFITARPSAPSSTPATAAKCTSPSAPASPSSPPPKD